MKPLGINPKKTIRNSEKSLWNMSNNISNYNVTKKTKKSKESKEKKEKKEASIYLIHSPKTWLLGKLFNLCNFDKLMYSYLYGHI